MGPYFFMIFHLHMFIVFHLALLHIMYYLVTCFTKPNVIVFSVTSIKFFFIVNSKPYNRLQFVFSNLKNLSSLILSLLYYVCRQVAGIWIEICFVVVVVGWQLHCVDCWDFSDSFCNGFVLFWLVQKFLCLKAFLLLYIRDIIFGWIVTSNCSLKWRKDISVGEFN